MLKRFAWLAILLVIISCTPPAVTKTAPALTPALVASTASITPSPGQTQTVSLAPSATLSPTLPPSPEPTETSTRAPVPTLTAHPTATATAVGMNVPGSDKIVFASQHLNPAGELSVMDLTTRRVLRLIGNLIVENLYPSLSPDGTRVVFSSRVDGNFELFSMKVDDETLVGFPEDLEMTLEPFDWLERLQITRLTWTDYDETFPAWSKDGAFIAYIGELTPVAELFVMPAEGGEAVQLSQDLFARAPNWSPDGQRIVFEDWSDGGGADLAWITASGGERHKLTATLGEDEESPAWSPDGTQIAFCKHYEQQVEIAVMPAAGGPAQRLTNHAARDCKPVWSRDGRQILFVSERSGAPNLFVMDANGEAVRQLTFYTRQNPALQGDW